MKEWIAPLAVGFAIASVAADPITDVLYDAYDHVFPVMSAQWQATRMNDGRYAIQFSGRKNRDCRLVTVWAYDVSPDGIRTRLAAARDGGPVNRHLEVGPFATTAPWLITPPPLGKLEVSFEHRCGSRAVITPARQA